MLFFKTKNYLKDYKKFSSFFTATFVAGFVLCCLLFSPVSVFAVAEDTTLISIKVISLCNLEIIVYPEKRIPSTNNWSNLNEIEAVSSSNQSLGKITLQADNQGKMLVDICTQYPISDGQYTFFVRGISHLRKRFSNIQIQTDNSNPSIQLGSLADSLLAGETSFVFDNKINSLDISTQIKVMYSTSNIKNDLNRDGKVNALDISNAIFNFYKTGQ